MTAPDKVFAPPAGKGEPPREAERHDWRTHSSSPHHHEQGSIEPIWDVPVAESTAEEEAALAWTLDLHATEVENGRECADRWTHLLIEASRAVAITEYAKASPSDD